MAVPAAEVGRMSGQVERSCRGSEKSWRGVSRGTGTSVGGGSGEDQESGGGQGGEEGRGRHGTSGEVGLSASEGSLQQGEGELSQW